MKKIWMIGCLIAVVCLPPAVHAKSVGVTAKAGTLGIGVELTTALTHSLNVRLGANNLVYKFTATESNIKYGVDLKLHSGSALLDWHPFRSGFRASAGFLFNKNEFDLTAKPVAPTYMIGTTSYAISDVGSLTANVDFNKGAGYAGIGWGNAVDRNQRVTFALDLGVVFQGTPGVDMKATGILATNPAFLADLTREARDLESELDNFKYYPVLSAGLAIRFF